MEEKKGTGDGEVEPEVSLFWLILKNVEASGSLKKIKKKST